MPTSLINSAVFRDIFSTEAMRRVFSDGNRVQKYLDFEAALARAQARLGIIPKEAADEIVKHCNVAEIDFAKLKTQTERIGYPVLPVVQQLVALCRDGLGEWCHWGATTQDITDSATVLQIREGLDLGRSRSRRHCAHRSPAWRANTATRRWPGAAICSRRCRSPSATRWRPVLAVFERHTERLKQLRRASWSASSAAPPARCRRSAAAGSKSKPALMKELGLGQPAIAWHTVRDGLAEVGCFLGLVTGTLGKIASTSS